jgi:hypothetical protein
MSGKGSWYPSNRPISQNAVPFAFLILFWTPKTSLHVVVIGGQMHLNRPDREPASCQLVQLWVRVRVRVRVYLKDQEVVHGQMPRDRVQKASWGGSAHWGSGGGLPGVLAMPSVRCSEVQGSGADLPGSSVEDQGR